MKQSATQLSLALPWLNKSSCFLGHRIDEVKEGGRPEILTARLFEEFWNQGCEFLPGQIFAWNLLGRRSVLSGTGSAG